MTNRIGMAVVWVAAGFLLGAAALVGGQGDEGDEDLREKLIELERLSAQLRALDSVAGDAGVVSDAGLEFDCIHLADVTGPVTDHFLPRRPGSGGVRATGSQEESAQPLVTLEQALEMVRSRFDYDALERGALFPLRSSILLFMPPNALRPAHDFIDRALRPAARRTVHLQVEIIEAQGPLAARLAAIPGTELEAQDRARIEGAEARLIFRAGVLALSRQQVALWHGEQAAIVADADASVAVRAKGADPVVDVEHLGTMIEVRCTAAEGSGSVRIQISMHRAEADRPARSAEAGEAGTLRMPAPATMRIGADLRTGYGRWALAGGATVDGRRRFLLVRPTVTGGAR